MKMKQALALLCVLLALGGMTIAVVQVMGDSESDEAAFSLGSPDRDQGDTTPTPTSTLFTDAPASQESQRQPESKPTRSVSGGISGRVLLESGEPCVGARITCDFYRGEQRTGFTSVLTNGKGMFVFGDLGERTGSLRWTNDLYELSTTDDVKNLSAGKIVNFLAIRSTRMPVSVEGKPADVVTSATLVVQRIAPKREVAREIEWSTKDPFVELPDGEYLIHAKRQENGELATSESVHITLPLKEGARGPLLVATNAPRILLEVNCSWIPMGSFHPLEAVVSKVGVKDPDFEDFQYTRGQDYFSRMLKPTYSAKHTFIVNEPGNYRVSAGWHQDAQQVEQKVTARSGEIANVKLALGTPSPDHWFEVLLEGEGKPIAPGAELIVTEVDADNKRRRFPTHSDPAITSGDGHFYIFEDFRREVAGGRRYQLFVSATGFLQRTEDLPAHVRTLRMLLEPSPVVRLRVQGFQDLDYKSELQVKIVEQFSAERFGTSFRAHGWTTLRVRKTLQPFDPRLVGRSEGIISQEGVIEIVGFVPGKYEFFLRRNADRGSPAFPVANLKAEVAHGVQDIDLVPTSFYDVTILLQAQQQGNLFHIRALDNGNPYQRMRNLTDTLSVSLKDVPKGMYLIRMRSGSSDEREMRLRIPDDLDANGELAFEPEPVLQDPAILVTITDENGAIGALGLEDGDKIIGLDGEEFEFSQHFSTKYREALLARRESVELILLRASQRVLHSVDLKALGATFSEGENLGGKYETVER